MLAVFVAVHPIYTTAISDVAVMSDKVIGKDNSICLKIFTGKGSH